MDERARLVVVYDGGAADPHELVEALTPLADLVVVVSDSDHGRSVMAPLRQFGCSVCFDDDPEHTLRFLSKRRPDGIVTFSEGMVRRTAQLAEALGLLYHAADTVEVLTDKGRQRSRLQEAGVDTTRNAAALTKDDWHAAFSHIGFPAVVKPVRGEGSRHTYLVQDPAAAVALFTELRNDDNRLPVAFVVEEFLAGRSGGRESDYVSVESAIVDGIVRHMAVTGKTPMLAPFRETGQFWPSDLDASETRAIQALASQAITALGVRTGLTHTEVKLTPDGPRIIEVNGRLGGHIADLGRRAAGFDLIALAGRLALGQKPTAPLVETTGVFFQCYIPAPTARCTLLAADGGEDLKLLPEVDGYRQLVAVGSTIIGGVGTSGLTIIYGHVDEPGQMTSALYAISDTLLFTFRVADTTVTLTGRELAGDTTEMYLRSLEMSV